MAQPGPNPQTNLIISIVLPVVAIITCLALYFTKPVVTAPAAPTAVNTTPAKLPDPGVQQVNALPGAASGGPSGAGGGPGTPGNKGGGPGTPGNKGLGNAPMGMGGSMPGGRPPGR